MVYLVAPNRAPTRLSGWGANYSLMGIYQEVDEEIPKQDK